MSKFVLQLNCILNEMSNQYHLIKTNYQSKKKLYCIQIVYNQELDVLFNLQYT